MSIYIERERERERERGGITYTIEGIIYDTLKKDDSDEDIITNVSEKMLSEFWNEEYSEYNSPELKKIEKVGKYESFKVFDKIDFTISYLAGHGVRNEKSLAAIFYRGKIIKVISKFS